MGSNKRVKIGKSKIVGAGRGVFAEHLIKKGEIIEYCPVLILPKKDYPIVKKTLLKNYYFMWGKVTCGICLGFGSLYNHSYEPNATYKKDIKKQLIRFFSIKDIKKGKEITVNYNYGNSQSKKKLWIKDIN